MSAPYDGPPVLFLHGFWRGGWCWTEVLACVTSACVRALAVEMAGHGLRARRPASLTGRPFDPDLLAAEVSPAAYARMPENEGGRVGALRVGDARAIGALRMDVASPDPAYRAAVRETFYADVDPVTADAAIALLTPDAPVGISTGKTTLTADGWGSIPRTYVLCTRQSGGSAGVRGRVFHDHEGKVRV